MSTFRGILFLSVLFAGFVQASGFPRFCASSLLETLQTQRASVQELPGFSLLKDRRNRVRSAEPFEHSWKWGRLARLLVDHRTFETDEPNRDLQDVEFQLQSLELFQELTHATESLKKLMRASEKTGDKLQELAALQRELDGLVSRYLSSQARVLQQEQLRVLTHFARWVQVLQELERGLGFAPGEIPSIRSGFERFTVLAALLQSE